MLPLLLTFALLVLIAIRVTAKETPKADEISDSREHLNFVRAENQNKQLL